MGRIQKTTTSKRNPTFIQKKNSLIINRFEDTAIVFDQ